jgi:hypothetical protein
VMRRSRSWEGGSGNQRATDDDRQRRLTDHDLGSSPPHTGPRAPGDTGRRRQRRVWHQGRGLEPPRGCGKRSSLTPSCPGEHRGPPESQRAAMTGMVTGHKAWRRGQWQSGGNDGAADGPGTTQIRLNTGSPSSRPHTGRTQSTQIRTKESRIWRVAAIAHPYWRRTTMET